MQKISKKLSDCVNYIHAVHFHDFEESEKSGKYYHMSSFGEGKATKFVEEDGKAFVNYNRRQISRIYPGAKRQDSSNLKPVMYWNTGCQIVALNYQTEDKQNMFNRARFCDNGGCGYVLKPQFLREAEKETDFSPVSPSNLAKKRFPQWRVDVQILSGQHIPRPDGKLGGDIIDPYVKVRVRGHPDDHHGGNKGKTDHVKNNGFNPVWKEGKFTFVVKVPQLAFLEFKVKDYSTTGADKDIGASCTPLNLVQEGYRRVFLEDYTGKRLSPAALLVHIRITEEE